MSQTWRDVVNQALAKYGAKLTADDKIERDGVVTKVGIKFARKRLEYCGSDGALQLATGPATAQSVCDFVERFWYWKPRP